MMNDKKKRKSSKNLIIAIILIIIGLLIFLYPTFSYIWNSYRDSRLITKYNDSMAEVDGEEKEDMLAQAKAYNEKIAARTTKKIIGADEEERNPEYESLVRFHPE